MIASLLGKIHPSVHYSAKRINHLYCTIFRREALLYTPTFGAFADLAKTHTVVPVYRQLIGDTLTPVTAFCKIQDGDWSFLFESVVGGERLGRYSFLGSGPFLRFQAHGRRVSIAGPAAPPVELEHPDPLRLLEERLAAYRAP